MASGTIHIDVNKHEHTLFRLLMNKNVWYHMYRPCPGHAWYVYKSL